VWLIPADIDKVAAAIDALPPDRRLITDSIGGRQI